jgi:hypothetical protein
MSILSALSENRHDKKNLEDLAKLPQALIMQMGQRKELSQEEVAMIINKKAEAIESAARQKALAQGGGQMPSVIEQDMMKIAQAENPAPQPMQQPMMPQQMAQAPQLPEDVGIAQNPVPPMQMAGGGIIAFDEGGDVDEEDEYQDLIDQAQENETNQNIFDLISEMGNDVVSNAGAGITAGLGNRNTESTGTGLQSFSAPDNKNSEFGIKAGRGEDKGDLIDRLRAEIMQRESGGRRYDKNGNLLTSSKGALGEMQVMPATARDPGFGIKPAKDINDPNELSRVGREYVGALLNKYQDPRLTMIAYNMGPGATDKWLAAGADLRRLPKETQGYIRGVSLASGGEVKRFQDGGTMGGFGAGDYDMDTLRVQEAAEAKKRKEYEDQYEFLKQNAPGVAAKMAPPPPSETRPMIGYEAKGPRGKNVPTEEQAGAFLDKYSKPAAPPPAAGTPRDEAEKETFDLMKFFRDQQARRDKAAQMDKWQAGLAAGLGMLGGTSQYWQENVGKGGQLGVQQLAQLQKLRATQDIASDKMLGTAYNAEMLGKLRKDQLAQGRERADADRAQRLITAKSAELGRRLKLKGITDEMIGMLEQKQMLKTIKPEELAKLNLFKQQMKKVEDAVNKEFSSDTTGFSARKIG